MWAVALVAAALHRGVQAEMLRIVAGKDMASAAGVELRESLGEEVVGRDESIDYEAHGLKAGRDVPFARTSAD